MSKSERIYGFVSSQISLLQRDCPWSKSMLAKLRRGVGKAPAETPDAWEITLNGLPEELQYKGRTENAFVSEAEWAIHTALTLYAIHQQGSSLAVSAGKADGGLSFGSAIRQMISPDGTNEESIKRRFDAVITSRDLCELSHHGRGLIQLMKTSPTLIKLDYPQFARDLYDYQFKEGRGRVRLQWGRDFYNRDMNTKKEKKENGE